MGVMHAWADGAVRGRDRWADRAGISRWSQKLVGVAITKTLPPNLVARAGRCQLCSLLLAVIRGGFWWDLACAWQSRAGVGAKADISGPYPPRKGPGNRVFSCQQPRSHTTRRSTRACKTLV